MQRGPTNQPTERRIESGARNQISSNDIISKYEAIDMTAKDIRALQKEPFEGIRAIFGHGQGRQAE